MTAEKKAPPLKKPKTYTIRPVDIRPGMDLIVAEWLVDVDVEGGGQPSGKLIGVPLHVLAMALPFMVIQCPTMGDMRGVLDTRKSSFMRVDKRFVKALLPKRKEIE